MSESEKKEIKRLAKKSKMNMSEFIRHAIFNKEIVVIDGIDQLRKDLKRIGNNLNQITTRANAGQFHTIYLEETKEEFAKIHDKIAALCSKKNELPLGEIPNEDVINLEETQEQIVTNSAKAEISHPVLNTKREMRVEHKPITTDADRWKIGV